MPFVADANVPGRLWFTRRNGEVRGPFPSELISSYLLLGRLTWSDEISHDRVSWQAIAAFPQLIPEEMRNVVTEEDRERLRRARRRHDERLGDRRRDAGRAPQADERRRTDRRSPEGDDFARYRAPRANMEAGVTAGTAEGRRHLVAIIVAVLMLAVVIAAFVLAYAWDWRISIGSRSEPPTVGNFRGAHQPSADVQGQPG